MKSKTTKPALDEKAREYLRNIILHETVALGDTTLARFDHDLLSAYICDLANQLDMSPDELREMEQGSSMPSLH